MCESRERSSLCACARGLLLAALHTFLRPRGLRGQPRVIGISVSGRMQLPLGQGGFLPALLLHLPGSLCGAMLSQWMLSLHAGSGQS